MPPRGAGGVVARPHGVFFTRQRIVRVEAARKQRAPAEAPAGGGTTGAEKGAGCHHGPSRGRI